MGGFDVESQRTTESPTKVSSKTQNSGPSNNNNIDKDLIKKLCTPFIYITICPFVIVISPFFIIFLILQICFTGKITNPSECFKCQGPKAESIYEKSSKFQSTRERIQDLILITVVRLGCLALVWLVVNLCVPSLKGKILFGSHLWKWSLLLVMIFLGYPCTLFISIILCTIFGQLAETQNTYYYVFGYTESVVTLLYFVWIFIMWMLYFRTDRGLNPDREGLYMYGTWTLASLLLGAGLWVLKTVVLLHWKTEAIYKRFKLMILMAGFQLFFLSFISDGFSYKFLLPRWDWKDEEATEAGNKRREQAEEAADEQREEAKETGDEQIEQAKKAADKLREEAKKGADEQIEQAKKAADKLRGIIRDHMLSRPLSLAEIKKVGDHVKHVAELTIKEDHDIAEIIKKCQDKIPANEGAITEDFLTNKVKTSNEDKTNKDKIFDLTKGAKLLLETVPAEQSSNKITCETFYNWMEDAHKNCFSIGCTLVDAFAVVSVLDVVLTCCIAVVVILFWLLGTGIATTKVLLTIASPFLAFTFVFGDTCKAFFQGVVFSFVTHPFDVGDQCRIDDEEEQLEVKNINILTTRFLGHNKQNLVIYANSELATKRITILKQVVETTSTTTQTENTGSK